jgi:hypothetical protein
MWRLQPNEQVEIAIWCEGTALGIRILGPRSRRDRAVQDFRDGQAPLHLRLGV